MKRLFQVAAASLALGMSMPASATILIFDIAGGTTNSANVPANYGDNVTALSQAGHTYQVGAEGFTANVTVAYPSSQASLWTTGYGNLTNVHLNHQDSNSLLTVNFQADAGYLVDLYGFDLASFLSGGQTIASIKVFDLLTNAELYSQGSTFITGATHLDLDFANVVSANGLSLVLNIPLGGDSDEIGIDNIRFGQRAAPVGGVPEPATWAMMIGGLGMIGAGMRRRRRIAGLAIA